MPNDEKYGILAGLSGLTQGILEGIKLRHEFDKTREANRLKEREIDIKEKAEASRTKYYEGKMEAEAESRDYLLGLKGVSSGVALSGAATKGGLLELAKTKEQTNIDKQIQKLTDAKAVVDRNLLSLKPESKFFAGKQKQSQDYAQRIAGLESRKAGIKTAASVKQEQEDMALYSQFASAKNINDIKAIGTRIEITSPGVNREALGRAAMKRFRDIQVEGVMGRGAAFPPAPEEEMIELEE